MIKSSSPWSVTLGVAAATFLSWEAVANLSAIALPEEEVLKKLDPVPVFTIADEQGTPLVAEGENEEKVAGVFVSLDDAKEFINQLKTENPELADKVRVVPVSLGEVYKLAGSAEGEENALNFAYVPQEEAVTQAKTIGEQNEQPYQGGVPLFVARGGEGKGYLTFERNSQQVIPFFFDKAQLEQMVARFKEQQPEVAASVDIEVHSLEGVIETLEAGSDEILEKIILVPFAESIAFLQQNATAPPAQGEVAPAPSVVKANSSTSFELADDFSEGLAAVEIDDKWGFIDRSGTIVVSPQYDSAMDFSEGLAAVSVNDKWGFIDQSGTIVIPIELPSQYIAKGVFPSFKEGYVHIKVGDKWGFIDQSGNFIITPQFDYANGFKEGLATVKINDKWGFIDRSGKIVIAPLFDAPGYFSEGLAGVEIDGKIGFVNQSGEMVITPQIDQAKYFSEGLAAVRINDKWGFIDQSGNVVISPQFEQAHDFHETLAGVKINDQWGFVNQNGEIVIAPQFNIDSNFGNDFSEGLAAVKINDKWGFVDQSGNFVITPQFEQANDFSEGLAAVKTNDEWGFIDQSGKFIAP